MAEFPLKAVLELDTREAEQGIDKFGDSFEHNLDSVVGRMDEMLDSLDEIAGNTRYLADSTEGSSQKQTQSWGRVSGAIAGATVVAAGFLKSMVDNSPALAGALAEIEFQFDRVANAVGDALAPAVEKVIPVITDAVDWFISLGSEVHGVVGGVTALVAGIGGASTAAGLFGTSLTSLVTGPFAIVIAGIAALVLAYKTNFGGLKDFVDETVGYMVDAISGWYDDNKEDIDRLIDLFVELGTAIFDALEPVYSFILDTLQPVVEDLFDGILDSVSNIIDAMSGLVDFLIGAFTGDWERAWGGIRDIFDAIWEEVKTIFGTLFDVIDDLFKQIFGINLDEFGGILLDGFKDIINGLADSFEAAVEGPVNNILDDIASIVDKIPGVSKPDWKIDIDIPEWRHMGGIVGEPGTSTRDVLGMFERGEGVIDAGTMRMLRNNRGGGMSQPINVTVNLNNFSVGNRNDVVAVEGAARRGAKAGLQQIQRFTKSGYVG